MHCGFVVFGGSRICLFSMLIKAYDYDYPNRLKGKLSICLLMIGRLVRLQLLVSYQKNRFTAFSISPQCLRGC